MKKLKKVPPAWILPCLVLMFILDSFFPMYEWLLSPWHYLSFIPIIISLLILGAASKRLARANTTLAPFGDATHLVTHGIYHYSRNPMYLGMALILLGCALFFGSITALIPVIIYMCIIQTLFIFPEEKRLLAAFGTDYEQFCQQVRRWI